MLKSRGGSFVHSNMRKLQAIRDNPKAQRSQIYFPSYVYVLSKVLRAHSNDRFGYLVNSWHEMLVASIGVHILPMTKMIHSIFLIFDIGPGHRIEKWKANKREKTKSQLASQIVKKHLAGGWINSADCERLWHCACLAIFKFFISYAGAPAHTQSIGRRWPGCCRTLLFHLTDGWQPLW